MRDGSVHPSKRRPIEYRAIPQRLLDRHKVWREGVRAELSEDGVRMPSQVHSFVVWEGRSTWNQEPIVVIATGLKAATDGGTNPKTGPLLQVYILPATGDPMERVRAGDDEAVCGDCVHRPKGGELADCYVSVQWAPRHLMTAYRKGQLRRAPESLFRGAYVRLGAWGDPAMVPGEVWSTVEDEAALVIGYTQQWRHLDVGAWGFLMASVEDEDAAKEAWSIGWRTFRTVYTGDRVFANERECHATKDHVSCMACGGCFGRVDRPSYYVRAHGQRIARRMR